MSIEFTLLGQLEFYCIYFPHTCMFGMTEFSDFFCSILADIFMSVCCAQLCYVFRKKPHLNTLCPFHTTGGTSRSKSFTWHQNRSQLPHFIQVVHTTGGRQLIGHGFLTISNNSRMTVLQTLVTKKQPPLISTHLR